MPTLIIIAAGLLAAVAFAKLVHDAVQYNKHKHLIASPESSGGTD